MTLRLMTLVIMTLNMLDLIVINSIVYSVECLYSVFGDAECYCVECCHAECRIFYYYAECGYEYAMLSVIVLSVVMTNVTFFTVMLSVVTSVAMLSVIVLSVVIMNVTLFYCYAECGYECCYAKCHCVEGCHAECRILLLLC